MIMTLLNNLKKRNCICEGDNKWDNANSQGSPFMD